MTVANMNWCRACFKFQIQSTMWARTPFGKTTFHYYFSWTESVWLVSPLHMSLRRSCRLQCCEPSPACWQWAKSWSSAHKWPNCSWHFFGFSRSYVVQNVFVFQPSLRGKLMVEFRLSVECLDPCLRRCGADWKHTETLIVLSAHKICSPANMHVSVYYISSTAFASLSKDETRQ